MRGYVGYKPASKEEMERREKAASQAAAQAFGKPTAYNELPQWLRDAHAKNKQPKQLPKPSSGG